jgi:hypothetical protein
VRHRWLVAALLLALLPQRVGADGKTLRLFPYWEDGKLLNWYNFGSRLPVSQGRVQAQPVWILTSGLDSRRNPIPFPGQGAIFDVDVDEPGYSDLSRVIWVTAPAGYVANAITSREQIEQAGLVQTPSDNLVNRPFVGSEDRLDGSADPPLQGWVRGEAIWYFDLGPASSQVGNMWRFVHGMTPEGQPNFVSGQYTVSDSTPSPFRGLYLVEVPADYTPNSITTVAQVKVSRFPIRAANSIANVPLPPGPAPISNGRNPGGYAILGVLAAAWLVALGYLLRLPTPRPQAA